MRFVDCGAFVGDTLSAVASIGARIEQVFAFEPDPENFAKLTAYTRDFARVTGGQVSLWPCAVTDETGPRRFRSSVGEVSSLGTDGDDVVCGVALDDVLPTTAVTDLKMDIEGAELDALRGAERLIRRSCPRLAICVYHRAEHLWEIPLFVRALGLPYDFFLRSHGSGGFDVVMYAVPHATA
jgi:FkbM family methyltransferase